MGSSEPCRVCYVPRSNRIENKQGIHYDGSKAEIDHSFLIITFTFRTSINCSLFVLLCIVSIVVRVEHSVFNTVSYHIVESGNYNLELLIDF